ncbi:SDR family oxidoreductase [Micromonospora sp. NPDC005206]|uniref:SDR family oxidoreductase n=1 Tax=Micromonospora sp. NPDC005206 TaxID=3157022 RepID=UPI0033BCED08
MPTYAVTGATGRLGRLVIQQLLDTGVSAAEIAAIVRTPEKAADTRTCRPPSWPRPWRTSGSTPAPPGSSPRSTARSPSVSW